MAGVTRRSSRSAEPIAPLKSAGRPAVGNRPHRSVSGPAGQGEAFLLAEELERERRAVLERWRERIPHRPRQQGKHHLMRDEEVVAPPPMLRVAAMPGGRRLGIAPDPVDHRRLQRRRAAELQAEVARKPRGRDHVHLLAHADVSAETMRSTAGLPRRRWRRSRPAASGAAGSSAGGSGAGMAVARPPRSPRPRRPCHGPDRPSRAELPAARPHRPQPDLQHRGARRRRAERRPRCVRCERRSRSR